MVEAQVVIVGGGVVGCAIARVVARPDRTVVVLEENKKLGLVGSARNSGVIHAGIYYPTGSRKAVLCVEGARRIYELGAQYQLACRKIGKCIVATHASHLGVLEALKQQGEANGVRGLELVDGDRLRALEPAVRGVAALHSAESGIVDGPGLVGLFAALARQHGADIVCASRVTAIERVDSRYSVVVRDSKNETSAIRARVVVNAAGLAADRIAEMVGIDIREAGLKLALWKGEYFAAPRLRNVFSHLVYPIPDAALNGLGIHTTLSLDDDVRFGPNALYLPESRFNYTVDEAHKGTFVDAIRSYYPAIQYDDLQPGYAGVRAKLTRPGEAPRDFYIAHEVARALPGFINCVGIDSPGLTASPAIGEYVGKIVEEILK